MLRNGLAKGDHQIAHAAVDNAVAMVELAKADVAIVTGGDNGFNHIFVQPEINAYADLRGKTVVVDAPNTAFALLLYKALKDSGLKSRMLLQVHDELLFEAPPEEVPAIEALAREIMEAALPLRVPLVVDVKSGADWAEV